MDTIVHNKKELLKALEKSLGIVTTACHATGIARSTFYAYCKDDPEFKKQVDEVESVALDFVESQLFEQIRNNVPSSTIFYLKTKGKKRGYVERLELTPHTPSSCVMVVPTMQSMDDWEKQAVESQQKLLTDSRGG
jgi:hypothetical protein